MSDGALPGLRLRLADAGDTPALFRIRTSVRENHMSREELAALGITAETLPAMLVGDGRGWVVERDGLPLGFAMANREEATVFAVFVDPAWEGHGIGRHLMTAAEDWLFACGPAEIWLLTDGDPSVRAHGFYRHLGWDPDGLQADGQMRYVKARPAPGPG